MRTPLTNYHLTYSLNEQEQSRNYGQEYLDENMKVAALFERQPERYSLTGHRRDSVRVYDADKHDLGSHRVKLELEAGHDSEVATTAAERPE